MKSKKLIGVVLVIVILLSVGFITIYGDTKEAGSMTDPLVTKSYVDLFFDNFESRIATIETKIDDLFNKVDNQTPSTGVEGASAEEINQYIDEKIAEKLENQGIVAPGSSKFEVVKMEEGQILVCEESTEVIVRSGIAKAVGNESGDGLADVTSGLDVKDQEQVEKNHLLIVPRTDGRGLKFESISYIMVKGKYTIK